MSFHNLSGKQNLEIARLLIGASKAIFIASAVALLFPPAGQPRPILFALIGALVAGVLASIGILMMKDKETPSPERPRGRRLR